MRQACESLGYPVTETTVTDEHGKVIPALDIEYAKNHFLAFDSGHSIVLLVQIKAEKEQAKAIIDNHSPEDVKKLFIILRRELMMGRCGYAIVFDKTDESSLLKHITIDQKLIVKDLQSSTIQRVQDAFQEILLVTIRCLTILSASMQTTTTTDTATSSSPPDGMYL
jgi:hypothetical protein